MHLLFYGEKARTFLAIQYFPFGFLRLSSRNQRTFSPVGGSTDTLKTWTLGVLGEIRTKDCCKAEREFVEEKREGGRERRDNSESKYSHLGQEKVNDFTKIPEA